MKILVKIKSLTVSVLKNFKMLRFPHENAILCIKMWKDVKDKNYFVIKFGVLRHGIVG